MSNASSAALDCGRVFFLLACGWGHHINTAMNRAAAERERHIHTEKHYRRGLVGIGTRPVFSASFLTLRMSARGAGAEGRDRFGLALLRPPRHQLQKKACTRPSRIGRTWSRRAPHGRRIRPISMLIAWCSSTRPAPAPTWRDARPGPRGERLVGKVPHGHWKTTTFIAGLRLGALTAPCVIDGPMTGSPSTPMWSRFWCRPSPGDIVVMDNLPAHKGEASAGQSGSRRHTAIPAALFARLQSDRAALRQAQSPAAQGRGAERSINALWYRIGELLTAFSAAKCGNYFRNAGYASH